MNPLLAEMAELFVPDGGVTAEHVEEHRASVLTAMVEREDQLLDAMRVLAAGMGLAPAMTALALTGLAMGTVPDLATVLHLQGQAQAEANAMHAQFHAMTGTECQCEPPDPS